MGEQYQNKQNTLTQKIKELEEKVKQKLDIIQLKNDELDRLKRDHQNNLEERAKENQKLKQKIDEMSTEFAKMLKVKFFFI